MDLVAAEFPNEIRTRGQRYIHLMNVRRVTSDTVEASVRGSTLYNLTLTRVGNRLGATCTCPYFFSTGPCKHLYALYMVATANGFLELAGTRAKDVRLQADSFVQREREDTGAAWRTRILSTTPPIESRHSGLALLPHGQQLIYVIDPKPAHGTRLVISPMTRGRKRDGEWAKASRQSIENIDITALDEPDRKVLEVLTSLGSDYSYDRNSQPLTRAVALVCCLGCAQRSVAFYASKMISCNSRGMRAARS